MTRREQIILLLGSLHDFGGYGPKPSRIKGAQRVASVAEWAPCERCGGRLAKIAGDRVLVRGAGVVTDRFGQVQPCPAGCDQGRVRVDSYTGAKLETQGESVYGTPFGMTFSEHLGKLIEHDTRHVDCPDCQGLDNVPTGAIRGERCRRCDGSGRAAIPGSWLSEPGRQATGDDDRLGLMIDRRDKAGSYHELDLALAALPPAYRRLVLATYVYGVPLVREPEPKPLPKGVKVVKPLPLESELRVKQGGPGEWDEERGVPLGPQLPPEEEAA